ncbi:MBOAT, membrane-bound o-acyltransferase family protein [Hirsutella rhossiliensis]|uniref:MBOAT, membrane-bound o-acyltransferase family domain-containing protein n=1 Tax=Hirsutella rhossiliensis TaxID=111463 RepID=A0A9P8SPV1_9HYPO|nr:MBOAT, membrane-bound o-acyltransferase family domain-containing protein [Hirsutella rhossiliensis]KAH0968586.1 MBOAT, membrane-bound o-acyltransferase family domain-containing protein [Hirsutella rhossiliensis]
METLSFLRKVYDLDTLDTRFTSSSAAPYQTVIDARSDAATSRESAAKAQARAQPPMWRTPEFYLYYLVFALAVPYMFWTAYHVSRPSDPRYHKYERFLSDGWIPGRKVDVSDPQYHTFRENLPYMGALLVLHPLLRRAWNAIYPSSGRRASSSGQGRLEQRASFDYAFALFFLVALHGVSAFKVLLILHVNFQIAKKLPRRYIPAATWAFNISTLFANELCEGYRLQPLATRFAPADSALVQWGAWLDGYGGLVSRWEVLFNISVLRLISFNMDYYWSIDKRSSNSLEKKQLDPANLSERDRISLPADVGDFTFRNYVAYAVYAPLYLAGPILTFNDYIAQLKHRCASIERPRTIRYAVRFVLVLLAMELVLHYDYVGAISKASPVWSEYTAAQLSLLSFFNLHIIWLKLLLPWRMFRLWALVDGIDPPENMVRCVSNNYSTQLFWRAWHRSYNRWLIRYLFIPLGGASFRNWRAVAQSIVSYLLVFSFVALWHDIQLRLLIWGWLIVLFMVPEWTASYLFPKRKWESRPTAYRMLCCVGAVANVIMMMAANLVGFAVGLDGLESIVRAILHDWSGLLFLVVACSCLFVGVQVMFEIREAEKRKGVTLKC